MERKTFVVALLCIFIAAFLWSTSFVITKILLDTIPPITLGAIRFVLSAIILSIIIRIKNKSQRKRFSGKILKIACLSGLLGIFLYFIFENQGINLAQAIDATLIVAAYPIITLIIEVIFKSKKVRITEIVGMLIGCIGVLFVSSFGKDIDLPYRWLGILLLLMAGVVWAFYNLSVSSIAKKIDPLSITYYQTVFGALALLLCCPIEYQRWKQPEMNEIFLIIYLALFCSIIGFLLYNYGLKYISSSTAVNILNLVPVFGTLTAVMILNERISGLQCIGGIAVIIAVYIVSYSESKISKPTQKDT